MTGFGGRAFEFLGQPGKIYSLLSEKYHQVGPLLAQPCRYTTKPHTAQRMKPTTKLQHKA